MKVRTTTIKLQGSGGRLLHINGRLTKPIQIRNATGNVLIQMGAKTKVMEIPDNAASITTTGVNIRITTEPTKLTAAMDMYDDLLEYRQSMGRSDLQWDHQLARSASQYATELLSVPRLQHSPLAGHLYGENLAAGYGSSEAAMKGLMNSPGHNDNMLYPGYRNVGIGYAASSTSSYHYYYVQQFR